MSKVKNIQQYILNSIDLSGYELPNTIANVWDVFNKEYYVNDARTTSEQQRFADWLMGMPTAMSVEVYYNEAKSILTLWGYKNVDKMGDTKAFDYFLWLIYRETKKLLNKKLP